jgi:hypothetical protein
MEKVHCVIYLYERLTQALLDYTFGPDCQYAGDMPDTGSA